MDGQRTAVMLAAMALTAMVVGAYLAVAPLLARLPVQP
jgi:hypothetical protein